jgi:ubiquinone/menaquinone biosynthesis C-methylase UbiE
VKQKDTFLQSEGDAWFARNASALEARELPQSDGVLMELLALPAADIQPRTRILEIGCGDGRRLAWLRDNRGFECFGVEPSAHAVEVAKRRGVTAQQGTADRLPFEDRQFDIIVFGFCLYLCDRGDLFRIACEADRVLKNPGWLLIMDFFSPMPSRRAYHHRKGLFSHKMDYRTLFTWNPAYTTYSHKVHHHSRVGYTDDADEWVATSLIRKNLESGSE